MSATTLPIEVLQNIFRYLSGPDVIKFRRVCSYWKNVVDSLPDEYWKEIFIRDRGDAELDVRRAQISWKDMYKSISLWRNIKYATMTSRQVPIDFVNQFQVVNNGLLAVLHNSNSDKHERKNFVGASAFEFFLLHGEQGIEDTLGGLSDTIIYFDLNTFQEVSREKFDFMFTKYQENNNFVTVIDKDGKLFIIIKANKKKFFVGELLTIMPSYESKGEFTMCENEVYFKNKDDMLCVSKVVNENGEMTVKTEQLDVLEEDTLAFSYGCDNNIILLTNEGNVYGYKNKDFEYMDQFDNYTQFLVHQLSDYGFDWTSPSIFWWLNNSFSKEQLRISQTGLTTVKRHGKSIIMGTNSRQIHIYADAYRKDGYLKTYRGQPDRKIDLNETFPSESITSVKRIRQIYALEKVNGHRLIVLSDLTVYILDFDYDKIEKPQKKIGIRSNQKRKPTKPKSTKATTPKPKCTKYRTRASLKK